MARKRRTQLNEFQADHTDGLGGPTFTVEPADIGDAHANRSADGNPNSDPPVLFTPGSDQGMMAAAEMTKSQMIDMMVDQMLKMKGDDLAELFSVMYDENGSASDAIETTGYNMQSVKGAAAGMQPDLDTGTVQYAAQMTAAAGDTTARPGPTQPEADPSGLLRRMATEEVEQMLGGENLSPQARAKIGTLFESAVSIKSKLVEAELVEEFQVKLEQGIEEAIETIVEHVDLYVSEAAKQYITENKLAFVDTARLAVNENFMRKFRDLLSEASIEVTESELTLAEAAVKETQIAERTAKQALQEQQKLKSEVEALKKQLIFERASVGLTMDNKEKLKVLAESVEFVTEQDFQQKLKILKEQRLPVKSVSKQPVDGNDVERIGYLEESTQQKQYVDRDVQSIASAMSKIVKAQKYPFERS
jgi:hypothetical protein